MAKETKALVDEYTGKWLEIKNFKSIKHIKLETSRVNIFIGRPNSGKSNLLEAFTYLTVSRQKKKEKPNRP